MASVIAQYQSEISVKTHQWTQGTFGCFSNIGICLVAYLLPCVSFGNTAAALGRDSVKNAIFYFIPFLNCYYFSKQREEIRDIRGIPGYCSGDVLCHMICQPCSLAQEAQEVQSISDDIITAMAARGQQVVVNGKMVTSTPIDTGHGQNYFPGMEPGALSQPGLDSQPEGYLHDMTPGPSLPPEVDDSAPQQNNGDIDRY